ncbi:MAG: pyridoxamine 5'-phosphate oxidase family protein [Rhizobiales bacterium]|nr:pyridoxamine 5'-phosphate oxidase family protein [Hyphomicrobiales bacterium]
MGEHRIDTIEQLEALYGQPGKPSLVKEVGHVTSHYCAFIEASPFLALASVGEEGLDCSPRGDAPGFVRVQDEKTVLVPDRRGNNRIDTLRNIIRDPRVSLLFLIPGIGETLRINGRAEISADPALLHSFAVDGKAPRSVLVVTVESIYFLCQKALVRSKLWDPSTRIERSALPSTGRMLQELSREAFDGDAYDRAYPERLKQTIY